MNIIKKIWPFSFNTTSAGNLLVKAILYVIITGIFITLMSLLGSIKILNIIVFIVSPLFSLYSLLGLVILLLDYFKIFKGLIV